MNTWDKIEDFIGSDDKIIRLTAVKIKGYKGALESGEMTADEFRELSEDLLDLKKLDDQAIELERRVIIKEAYESLLSLVSAVPIP